MTNQSNIPNAPKSKKVGQGVYITNSIFGIVEIILNEGTGMWQTVKNDVVGDVYNTKKEAINSLIN